jgi:mono/diheme cytochrome c family protein
MRRSLAAVMIVAPFVAAFLPAPGAAQVSQVGGSSAAAIAEGRDLFAAYCASCHGPNGHGNGPAADTLHVRPPDLATMTARASDGVFVPARVERIIDGRDVMVAHGTMEMPVWGSAFTRHQGLSERAARARIEAIVRFLASIQERSS